MVCAEPSPRPGAGSRTGSSRAQISWAFQHLVRRLFRLDSPDPGRTDALAYVAQDRSRAAVFVFARAMMHTQNHQLIRIRGLDVDGNYRVTNTETDEVSQFSGAFLAGHGLLVPLTGHYDSTILLLDRI